MIIEGMVEDGLPIPVEAAELMPEPRVTVAVPAVAGS